MADIQDRLKLQQAHATNTLNYGHLGTATYVEGTKAWAFLRKQVVPATKLEGQPDHTLFVPAFPFEAVEDGANSVLVDHDSEPDHPAPETPAVPSSSIGKILRSFPEQMPGLAQVTREDYGLSEKSESLNLYPRGQDCLAFGAAVVAGNGGNSLKTVPVVAAVGGSSSDCIKLVRIGKGSVSLCDFNGVRNQYQVPSICGDEVGWWTCNGGRVLQISFAAAGDAESPQRSWMAARQASCVTLFHPMVHNRPVSARRALLHHSSSSRPASRLDVNPILDIPISRTGGHPHANVAFHPQDHKTLAIVDEHGNWSIWKVEGRRSIVGRVLFRIHLHQSGRLLSLNGQGRPLSSRPYHDGWHRVGWLKYSAYDANRLLVCNRMSAAVYDSNGVELSPVNLRLGNPKYGQWILDMKKSTTNPGHCFILTSTRLMLVSAADEIWVDTAEEHSPAVVLSWLHFRGRADLKLRLTLVETARSTTVLVSSLRNTLVTAFRFGFEDSSTPVSIADPVQLNLPLQDDSTNEKMPPVILDCRDLQVRKRSGNSTSPSDPVLLKLFLQLSDRQIVEVLYKSTEQDCTSTFGQPNSTAIALPYLRMVRRKSTKYAELDDINNLDEFITTDEPEIVFIDSNRAVDESYEDELGSEEIEGCRDITLDWQDVYNFIASERASTPGQSFMTMLSEINRIIKSTDQRNGTLRLLAELTENVPEIRQIEVDSSALIALVEEISASPSWQATPIHSAPRPWDAAPHNLLELYSQLAEAWLTVLPPTVPDRVRLRKWHLLRSIVGQLALSGLTLRKLVGPPIPASENHQDQQDLELNLPSSPSHKSTLLEEHSASQTPRSRSQSPSTVEDPACIRLRSYGSMTKPIVPISTSKMLTDLLAHLPTDTNANPLGYDWLATEEKIAAENSAEGASNIDPKARRRAEKMAAIRRKRLEAQKQTALAVEQAQAPPQVLSSQISRLARETESNQVIASSQTPEEDSKFAIMTQPERGISGIRAAEAGKGKNKKIPKERNMGF